MNAPPSFTARRRFHLEVTSVQFVSDQCRASRGGGSEKQTDKLTN
jgi:hypothetical protein